MVRHVIWDWNGTLLDDVACTVATLNALRTRRQMPPVSLDEYRHRFGFPVRAFYEEIGFDFAAESFADLSRDFIAEYRTRAAEQRLSAQVIETLRRLRAQGIINLVVSAMEANLLAEMLATHALVDLLAGHHGRADHSAGSKVDLGVEAARSLRLDPTTTLVVGDTLHDLELARAIGCRAVLFTGGHQSRARLEQAGVAVIDHLSELDQHLAIA